MQAKIVNNLGDITIATDVIATIVGEVAMHCYGVVGMAARSKADGIVTALRRDMSTKGIRVTVEDDGITVELHIVVEYGVNIKATADSIESGVKYQVEEQTGFVVKNVIVRVDSVRVN